MEFATYPDLAGKNAVVTGGSKGIGAATARALAANGVTVAVVARGPDDARALAEEIGGIAIAADCTDERAVSTMRERVAAELGDVDVLAAFVGGGLGRPNPPTAELSAADWRHLIDTNLTSAFLTVTAFLPELLARRAGSVITMSSTAGRRPGLGAVGYAAAKAGVQMFTKHVAAEVADRGVRLNCVAPGAVRTERTAALIPLEVQKQLAASNPLGRIGRPEDVAQATLYLASDASSWLTGQIIDISGGKIM